MPRRSWIDDDFRLFKASFLSSLTPNIPLQTNLSAVMFPALAKLRFYSHATVAVHFFVNPYFREVHALLCGASELSDEVVRSERRRRAVAEEMRPSSDLPAYIDFELETKKALDLFRERDEEYASLLKGDLLDLMKTLASRYPAEFDNHLPKSTDTIIVLPLRSAAYTRLGWFVLWAADNQLRNAVARDREIRSTFQNRLLQLLVRIFTNFYGMEPGTGENSIRQNWVRETQ